MRKSFFIFLAIICIDNLFALYPTEETLPKKVTLLSEADLERSIRTEIIAEYDSVSDMIIFKRLRNGESTFIGREEGYPLGQFNEVIEELNSDNFYENLLSIGIIVIPTVLGRTAGHRFRALYISRSLRRMNVPDLIAGMMYMLLVDVRGREILIGSTLVGLGSGLALNWVQNGLYGNPGRQMAILEDFQRNTQSQSGSPVLIIDENINYIESELSRALKNFE